jgi:hypothetical protein
VQRRFSARRHFAVQRRFSAQRIVLVAEKGWARSGDVLKKAAAALVRLSCGWKGLVVGFVKHSSVAGLVMEAVAYIVKLHRVPADWSK